jgi:hypothetical protein
MAADADRELVPGAQDAAFDLMAKSPSTTTGTTTDPPPKRRRIRWPSVITVLSAAVLIGSEVFGTAYAGGWAVANLLDINSYVGEYGTLMLQVIFFALGFYVMALFLRAACRAEPFFVAE